MHQLFNLIESVNSVINDKLSEDDNSPDEFQGLMDRIQESFLKYFPNGYFRADQLKTLDSQRSATIAISIRLVGDRKKPVIDPMSTSITIFTNGVGNKKFQVGSTLSGLAINSGSGAKQILNNPLRKFFTNDQNVVITKLDQYFAKCRDIVKANWDNIYGVDQIDPKYMVEGDAGFNEDSDSQEKHYSDVLLDQLVQDGGWDEEKFDFDATRSISKHYRIKKASDRSGQFKHDVNEILVTAQFDEERYRYLTLYVGFLVIGDIDGRVTTKEEIVSKVDSIVNGYIKKTFKGSDIQESSNPEVTISHQDLLQASSLISKYPNDIRIKVKGKNKFCLELYNKSLLDTDKTLASLFKSLKESMNIVEDGEEVFSNDTGKVIASIKDGKKIFTAYNDEGNIVGKPYLSKTIAVTALAIAKSKSTQPVQEAEMATIEVPATGSEFFRLLDKIPGDFSEDNPLKLGNTEFWKDKLGVYAGQWAYYPSTNKWDNQSITNDLLRILQTNKGNE